MGFSKLKSKCQQGCIFFESPKESPFPASTGCPLPVTCGPFHSIFEASNVTSLNLSNPES